MHKERFIQLIKLWKQEIGSPNLDKLLIMYKLMGIQEQKAGITFNPALIIPAARDRKLALCSLFGSSGSSFFWVEIQQEQGLAVFPASGDAADARTASEATLVASVAPVPQPLSPRPTEQAPASDSQALARACGRAKEDRSQEEGQDMAPRTVN